MESELNHEIEAEALAGTEQVAGSETALAEAGPADKAEVSSDAKVISSIDYDEITRRAFDAAQRAFQEQRVLESQWAQRAAPSSDPAAAAMDAVDLRNDMYEEAVGQHEDMPREAKAQLRSLLRGFRTLDALRTAQAAGLHKTLADAAYGKAVREGRHTPSGLAPSVKHEPVHSEPSARIPSEFRREQEEVCRLLGVTLSEAELQAAWRSR